MAFAHPGRRLLRLGATCFALTAGSAWLLQATGVPVLWPAAGLLIAWFGAYARECDKRALASCWIGGVLALLPFGWTLTAASLMMALTVCEACLARTILQRLKPDGTDWFDTLDGFLLFLVAALLASGIVAIPASLIAGPITQITGAQLWLGWAVAACLGTLTVTPIAWLVYSGRLSQDWRRTAQHNRVSTYCALVGVAAVTTGTFVQSVWPLLFLPLVPLVLTAFKSDRVGVILALLVFTDIAIIATELGYGPIAEMLEASPTRFLVLQIYLGTAIMIALPASLELRERELVTKELQSTLERLTASEREAHDLAYTDPLTGLSNRRSFLNALDAECREQQAVTVAIIDLNQFKSINDRWGHLVGDEILRAVSERFLEVAGPEELVARLGGDEFAWFSVHPSSADPLSLGRRIVASLDKPILIGRREFPISCACGLVRSDAGEARSPSSLLGRADIAMYAAKTQPSDPVVVFSASMRASEERKLAIVDALLSHETRAEIQPEYQPVFDLHSGRIVSMEALARWRHPTMGPISPAEFIPLAERAKVIEPLTWSLLAAAIRDAVRWDPDISLSFNFSAPHLGGHGVVEELHRLLERGGLEPGRLKLEITETALLTDSTAAAANCEKLQRSGIKIVLDDFGSGFASLSYLHALRFDEIKLDSSLTLGARRDDGLLLAKGVLDLCHALNVPCTAEHLETVEDVERFVALGCRFGQGYWLHRPVSASDALALAREQENVVRLVRRPALA